MLKQKIKKIRQHYWHTDGETAEKDAKKDFEEKSDRPVTASASGGASAGKDFCQNLFIE